ncbi:phage head completion protein [Aureimonas ureilytica]|uniref:phage head completion protein n=1 Tax=Aureimonas ureilytica TaxID=401562 RepID=UPI00037D986C|nr:hypothetical protein [Aureimonas ureilytica]
MLDVSKVINSVTGGTVSLIRKNGAWVRGKWVAGPEVKKTIIASVQPLKGSEVQNLPEGIRNEAQASIFTAERIAVNDEIEEGGQRYVVLSIDDWQRRGAYTKGILGLLRPPT